MKAAGDADERNVCNSQRMYYWGYCMSYTVNNYSTITITEATGIIYHHYVHTRCIISRTVTNILIEIIS